MRDTFITQDDGDAIYNRAIDDALAVVAALDATKETKE